MDITWEEPPPHAKRPGSGQKPGRYAKIATALRQNPGRWALIGKATSEKSAEGTANNIRRGKVKGFELPEDSDASFDVAVDEFKIYVRYLEDAEEGAVGVRVIREEDAPSRGEIRAWARENGFQVAVRGALPKEILDAYNEAHPD